MMVNQVSGKYGLPRLEEGWVASHQKIILSLGIQSNCHKVWQWLRYDDNRKIRHYWFF